MKKRPLYEVPMMPELYKGEIWKKDKNKHSMSRHWTKEEDRWLMCLYESGYDKNQIGLSMDRTETSISTRLKYLRKSNNTYNQAHVVDKYNTNNKFIQIIKPKSVLDLYCGVTNFYKDKVKNVTSNDKEKTINADYNMEAYDCISYLYSQNEKYDLIDLDPYGSAYNCFDLAIKMAKKGVVVTLGEMYCKRWKNEKFIKERYNLSLEEFTVDNIIDHIQTIGIKNNKKLYPIFIRKWKNIARVWFKVQEV